MLSGSSENMITLQHNLFITNYYSSNRKHNHHNLTKRVSHMFLLMLQEDYKN